MWTTARAFAYRIMATVIVTASMLGQADGQAGIAVHGIGVCPS
jgi:hypothetical protein